MCVCFVQMVSAVCQFPTVQSTVEASVAVMQSSIPIARIGLHSLVSFHNFHNEVEMAVSIMIHKLWV